MTGAAGQSSSAGFTLVEAMLATLLMSIILAALAAVTGQWLPSWDRGVRRLQGVELVAVGLDRLTDDLAAAEFVSAGTGDDAPLFDGGELSVAFVRTTLAPNAGTGLQVVRIAETSDGGAPVLVRSTAPFAPNLKDANGTDGILFSNPVVMLRAPYRVTFSYAGPDRVWQDTWRGRPELPRAVRVRVRDMATSMTLAVSTSTLIHAELPARCTWAKTLAQCPGLGRGATSSNELGGGAPGGE
jgi:general secretion pathway protein J